ncbi:hypothetical protein TSOC_003254 [Tetrabaena socialis]|uniref:U-box domain-containing protein n=1 Tax=Tetrabaena socialis TaxID=47790 RepID=A0A2J8AC46_9CHLO|nr:hypothetical protein TSOC_003254 [Tetrabaena socialis]|eukprot:PNH10063.1 hypothetical protein TSOC_003254 [Tetrabaena socialis]
MQALVDAEQAQQVEGRPQKRAWTEEGAAPAPAPPAACAAVRLAPEVRVFTEDVPSHLFCRLSWALVADPVADGEGNTWERAAISAYVQAHGKSPLTGADMALADLVAGSSVQDELTSWLAKNSRPRGGRG